MKTCILLIKVEVNGAINGSPCLLTEMTDPENKPLLKDIRYTAVLSFKCHCSSASLSAAFCLRMQKLLFFFCGHRKIIQSEELEITTY